MEQDKRGRGRHLDEATRQRIFRSAEAVFRPRTVAIVGATDKGGGGWSKRLLDNLSSVGRGEDVFLINPRRSELWGRPCYAGFASLPRPAELAITIVPADAVTTVLADGTDHGVKAALIYAAQFGEGDDPEGARRGAALKSLADARGLRFVGPNCMGTLALRERNLFYPSTKVRALPEGGVGAVFQSGGTFIYWLQRAAERGLGFSYAVSSGNELDLDLADYINFMVDDPETRLIACLVEGVRRPMAFCKAAEGALEAGKPVLVVKTGRSERAAAQAASHTGALAGDDRIFDAVCRKYGVIRCHSLDDMIECALAFDAGRIAARPGTAMACYSGGAKGLFLDYAEEEGLQVPELAPVTQAQLAEMVDSGQTPDNPLDAGASFATAQKRFGKVARAMASDPNVGIVALQGQLPALEGDAFDAEAFRALAEATAKPVIAIGRLAQNVSAHALECQRQAGIPFIQGLPQGVRVARALGTYGAAQRRGVPELRHAAPGDATTAQVEAELAETVPAPKGGMSANAAEAGALAQRIGFPVAVKIVSPAASHKTEVGGVRLGLNSAAAVEAAAAEMSEALTRALPGSAVQGFLVQEMVEGLELLIGVREDDDYGPFLVLGLGGVTVEAVQDVAIRMLPVTAEDVAEMVAGLRGAKLFAPFRGRPARDMAALERAALGACEVFARHRSTITDLEINPLILLAEGEGARAVDVRLVAGVEQEGKAA